MTEPPLPPIGAYPPPPPQGGGYLPPQGTGLPTDAYTPWLTRVLATLIDLVPYAIILGIGLGIEALTQETDCVDTYGTQICVTGNSTAGVASVYLSALVGLAYIVWNYGFKQGTTGSTIGKAIMKFKVVSEETGQPIGTVMSIVRQFAHTIDGLICYIGFLFPLWDAKRQTIADKLIKTICLPTG